MIREIGVLVLFGVAVVPVVVAPGCGGGASIADACSGLCDKQEACGDIDSVKADQCRKKCAADAQLTEAALDKCANKGAILAATSQCLTRACTDYTSCLTTLPACIGGGTGGSTTTGSGAVLACDSDSSGAHICISVTSTTTGTGTGCPSGSTQVAACDPSDLLGTCAIDKNGVSGVEFFYAGGSITETQAQQYCSSAGGTWTASGP